ncbi:MAG: DUF4159 domain-containing protein [Gemmatimonadetes bacterium]|nr:DUF4159 domain-containing protein [Gemmatimonadota bacterium]
MRFSSQASSVLAVVAVSAFFGACEPRAEAVEEPAQVVSPGSELMAQQAPQVQRPTFTGARGPRMDPSEVSGRWPFYWTRAIYSGYRRGWGGYGSWAIDFPKGDRQFLFVLKRLVRLDAYDWENAISLADPKLRRFPVIYMVEPGYMDMTEAEVDGLRGYLDAGGFLIVDDFWGTREWDQFEYNIRRVYPDKAIVDITLDHNIYSAYYDIEQVMQVPALNNAIYGYTAECRYWPCDPQVKGMYDDEGRLMVIINFNTDLGDAWEWAEDPRYPLKYSTYAYEMGANMIVYAMSH